MPRWLLARPYLHATALGWINLHQRNRAVASRDPDGRAGGGCAGLTLPAVGRRAGVSRSKPGHSVCTRRRRYTGADRASQGDHLPGVVDIVAGPSGGTRFDRRTNDPPCTAATTAHERRLGYFLPGRRRERSWSGATLGIAVAAAWLGWLGLVGWLAPHDKTVGAPDFHYVTIRKPRPNWTTAPRLESACPTGLWGRRASAAKPKTTAKALIFVLLALPLGTPGEKVIAIAGGDIGGVVPVGAGHRGGAGGGVRRALARGDDGAVCGVYLGAGAPCSGGAAVDLCLGRGLYARTVRACGMACGRERLRVCRAHVCRYRCGLLAEHEGGGTETRLRAGRINEHRSIGSVG